MRWLEHFFRVCEAERVIPASGIRFGRFRLLDELGRGGMAVVFRAVVDGPKGFARSMVLKRILRDCAQDPAFVNMLASEARLSALLRHPNIVQVHEFGEVDGELYLAMDLVEGTDLVGLLRACRKRKLRPPPGVVCYLVAELASALAYAHSLTDEEGRRLEIVHRDVSPANVMVTSLGMVKLLDFGIAKAARHMRTEQTRTGIFKGKLSYLSPEQADGRLLDRRSDVFSLGIVFYEYRPLSRSLAGNVDAVIAAPLQRLKLASPQKPVNPIPNHDFIKDPFHL